MQLDPLTVFAVGGVASLLIERFFYYRSKYKEKKIEGLPEPEPDNPGDSDHGERIKGVETEIKNLKEANTNDHRLIRKDIQKLFGLFNGVRRK